MLAKPACKQFILLGLYIAAMALLMFNGWRETNIIRTGGGSPLYRSLTDGPAYIRHGFDPAQLRQVPDPADSKWVRFAGPPFSVVNAPLPDLPKRPFLYPWSYPDEEFTIIIPVEMDGGALSFLDDNPEVMPGMYFNVLGENWEIYFNGEPVNSQWHPDGSGQIAQRRTWWHLYFPLDRSLLTRGTNIVALRIVGDPAYIATGLTMSEPYYLDDYQVIQRQHSKYLHLAFIGIFVFAGAYYLMIFLSVRNRREVYYLYFSIFSILLSLVTFQQHRVVNEFIPNLVYTPLSYIPALLMFLALCMFVETIGRGRVTKVTWAYLAYNVVLILAQAPFSGQFGEDITLSWHISFPLYLSYVFFYDIVYFYFWDKNGPRKRGLAGNEAVDLSLVYIFVSFAFVYAVEVVQIVNLYFFNRFYVLRENANFIVQIGMTFILASRFGGMYRQLEQSNVVLETKVKERTLELEEQTAIAVQANRAKSDFLATMSHEIRTPLNAVIGLSEIVLNDRLPDSSKDKIEQIHQSGSTLLGVIGDILDISKIEAGSFELVPVEYETPSMLSDTVHLNMVRIGSKPIDFILEIGGDFPSRLVGDELRVKQILNNLLSNAAKYTHEGTITLSVEHEARGENTLIRFTVRDTGIGIRSEDMGKLFENYAQLDSNANRKIEGTGLGLSIAQKLAEMMGGSIAVESEYGKGSCFTTEIIQGLAGDTVIGEETAESLRSFRYAHDRKKDTIAYSWIPHGRALVVDDIPANLRVIRGLLAPYGLQTDTAASGQEAIEKIQNGVYDLVFMDHMMPEMDGVETVAALHTIDGFNTPIVAMTANALRGMKEFYLEQGFDDYLPKPVSAKALDGIVKKWFPAGNNSYPLPINHYLELETQRLDKLNHFRVSFEADLSASGHTIDSEYFKRFTALIQSLNIIDAHLQEQAASLTAAGQQEDALKIREILPAFCAAFGETLRKQPDGKTLDEVLYRLKKALRSGESKTAGTILAEIGAVRLDAAQRRLYFLLYGLLYEGNTEKALDALYFWEKLHD